MERRRDFVPVGVPVNYEALAAQIVQQLASKYPQGLPMSEDRHSREHDWIEAQMERDRERIQFWQDMRKHIGKWGAVSVLSFIGYWLWLAFKAAIKAV